MANPPKLPPSPAPGAPVPTPRVGGPSANEIDDTGEGAPTTGDIALEQRVQDHERPISRNYVATNPPPDGLRRPAPASYDERMRAAQDSPATLGGSDGRYLIARSRRSPGFRRAGIQFSSQWQTYAIADMTADQLRLIQGESMIESRVISSDEAAEHAKIEQHLQAHPEMSQVEVAQHLTALSARVRKLEEENADLRHRLSGADHPPKTGQTVSRG